MQERVVFRIIHALAIYKCQKRLAAPIIHLTMSHPLIREIQTAQTKDRPTLEPGYVVRIHQKIREGEKDRIQIFEGVVIKIGSGTGSDKSVRVRKVVEGVGVEKIYPINSPAINEIEIVRKGKIRRAKLYYMRALSGRKARLAEKIEKKAAVAPVEKKA